MTLVAHQGLVYVSNLHEYSQMNVIREWREQSWFQVWKHWGRHLQAVGSHHPPAAVRARVLVEEMMMKALPASNVSAPPQPASYRLLLPQPLLLKR